MKKNSVNVVFDRKYRVKDDGIGAVEVVVNLSRLERKYISVGKCKRSEVEQLAQTKKVQAIVKNCEKVVAMLDLLGLDNTVDNFNIYYNEGVEPTALEKKNIYNGNNLDGDFLAWFEDDIANDDLREGTRKHKEVTLRALRAFGKIRKFSDLTAAKVAVFDDWLRDGTRTEVTMYTYHKNLRTACRKLRMADMIPSNPYEHFRITHGKSKEREPLTEKELKRVCDLELSGMLEHARDLFQFSAFTGLSYSDTQCFDYGRMVVKEGKMYYIDGNRIKNDNKYFTPILAPAMSILKKYHYKLPKMSNQKCNAALHMIQIALGIRKSMTMHVARHTFATMALAHDIPIENVARMLGHTDIKTTQIYAKILKSTIERHSEDWNKRIG